MGLIRKGFLGCLGTLAFLALVIAVVAFVGWLQVRGGSDETFKTSVGLEPEDAAASPSPTLDRAEVLPHDPFVLDIDIAWAQLYLKPGEDLHGLRLEATYDPKRHVLEQTTDEGGDGRTIHRVRYHPLGTGLMAAVRPMVGARIPRLTIEVPTEVPISIHGAFSGGIAVLELGRLQLVEADLAMQKGIMQVQLREPTARPVESLSLSCHGGNLVLYNMGHASPRRLVIHQGMGPGFFDLAGEWTADSEVEVSVGFGSGHLRVPSHVAIRGLERPFADHNFEPAADSAETPPSTLDMNVHFDVGHIKVTRIPE